MKIGGITGQILSGTKNLTNKGMEEWVLDLQGGPERFTIRKTPIKIIPDGEWKNGSTKISRSILKT